MFSVLLMLFCAILTASSGESEANFRRAVNSETMLTSQLSLLHRKLFMSLHKRIKIMKMAVFETKCTKKGCTFKGYTKSEDDDDQTVKPKVCKKGWKKFRDSCYFLFKARSNWNTAQQSCKKQNSSLVQIDSKDENDWLKDQFKSAFWTDGNDIKKEGDWVWFTSGKKIGPFKAWLKRSNEPNGKRGENCMEVNQHKPGTWNDSGCGGSFAYVCEM